MCKKIDNRLRRKFIFFRVRLPDFNLSFDTFIAAKIKIENTNLHTTVNDVDTPRKAVKSSIKVVDKQTSCQHFVIVRL